MPQSLEEMAELKEKAEAKGYQFCIDQMKYPGYGFQYMCNIVDTSDLSTLGGRQRQKAFLAGETTLADSPEMLECFETINKWRDLGLLNGKGDNRRLSDVVTEMAEGNTQNGPQGLLKEMEVLADAPDRVSFVTNTPTTGDARMVFLYRLDAPIALKDGNKTVKLTYYGLSQAMEALNPYFDCDAYSGNNSVYVLDDEGLRLFNSSRVELLSGFNVYSVLSGMEYLHGSSFEATRQKLEETGLAYSNAMLDGTEYYYAFYRMENARWTLLFLVPSSDVAVNTVRLVNMTIEMILVLAVVLVAAVGLAIFLMLKRQQKLAVAAERRNTAELAAANEKLDHANTELRRAVEAAETAFKTAEAASQSKSDFLTNMSHDIRTPMNAMIGITTLIDHDADSPEKVHEYVRKIRHSNEYLLGIINDVLDMSQIESGKTVLNVGEFDIRDIVDQIDAAFRLQTKERRH